MGSVASAQNFPNRTVRIIVPFPPGGLVDTSARLIQPYLEKALGQTVIVDNRPTASGIVGTDAVAKAQPDGHTLLMVASSHTVTPATNQKLPYDTEHDLAPIAILGKNPLLFVINAKVPAKTLAEFVALAKASPGKFNYATPGAASQSHLVTELFDQRAGIKMQHIPYRGGAPAIQATVAGETEFVVISPLASLPHIQAGTLRADRGRQPRARSAISRPADDRGAGLCGVRSDPVGRPSHHRRHAEADRRSPQRRSEPRVRDPALIKNLAVQGVSPAGGTPEEFGRLISTEIRNWTAIAKAANIKAE